MHYVGLKAKQFCNRRTECTSISPAGPVFFQSGGFSIIYQFMNRQPAGGALRLSVSIAAQPNS